MTRPSVLVALAVLPLLLAAQDTPAAELSNLSFEYGPSGRVPASWTLYPDEQGPGRRASIVTKDPHEGRKCAVLENRPDESKAGAIFLYQDVAGASYAGKRVHVTAALRWGENEPDGFIHLWAAVWLPGEDYSTYDLGEGAVTEVDWTIREIVFDVPPNAETVQIGFKLMGWGTAWVDDVSVEVLGEAGPEPEGPRPLREHGLENLVAFARLLGYVRHFHPSDEAATTDWDRFAIEGVRMVEDAATPEALVERLRERFAPIAPTVQIWTGEAPELPVELSVPDTDSRIRVVRWSHSGFGPGDGVLYKSKRWRRFVRDGKLPSGVPDPAAPWEAELVPSVRCRVPLALFSDSRGTLPHGTPGALEPVFPACEDRATRLAAVILAWNVYQHFYPYFDVVETDWSAKLDEALASAATDRGVSDFRRTLERLLAGLHDGHAWVQGGHEEELAFLPLAWAWVEERLVVMAVPEDLGDVALAPGDVIETIDGLPAEEVIREAETRAFGATPAAIRHAVLRRLLRGKQGDVHHLGIRTPAGERREVELAHHFGMPFEAPRLPKVHEVDAGILYVDLDRVDDEDLDEVWAERLDGLRGLVFDLRGYPSRLSDYVAGHLIDETLESPRWLVPSPRMPDRAATKFEESSWRLPVLEPRIRCNVAVITDERAQSAAETYLSFIEHAKLAVLVGRPTAGTNGNINWIELPGGLRVSFTGMKVLKRDDSRHHGVGVLPTMRVDRTHAGVVEGRDEQLDAAVAVVSMKRGDYLTLLDPTGGAAIREANAAHARGEYSDAVAAYSLAIELAEDDEEPLFLRGWSHFALGDRARALVDFTGALELEPDSISGLQSRGFVRFADGDTDGALEDYDRAIALDPGDPGLRQNRAHARYALERWDGASEDFRAMEADAPDEVQEATIYLWLIEVRRGRRNEATAALEEKLARLEEPTYYSAVADLFLGRTTAAEFLVTDPDASEEELRLMKCLDHFFTGTERLLDEDLAGAREHYEESMAAGSIEAHEHWTARTRLESLGE